MKVGTKHFKSRKMHHKYKYKYKYELPGRAMPFKPEFEPRWDRARACSAHQGPSEEVTTQEGIEEEHIIKMKT